MLIFRKELQEDGWGIQNFRGFLEQEFFFPVGPNQKIFNSTTSTITIFDFMWNKVTKLIYLETDKRKEEISKEDINLYLAATLVMGLNSQPTQSSYFEKDDKGISGCHWMKERFTLKDLSYIQSHIHFDHSKVIQILRKNFQDAWELHKQLVVDELIVPFTGRWKYRQYVKGKPHTTGILNKLNN